MPEYTVESTRAYIPASALNLGITDSPERVPTTSTGVVRGRALFDPPPPGTQPESLRRSDRARTATKRAQEGYLQSRAKSNERSEKIRRTRARSQSQASQNAMPTDCQPADDVGDSEAELEDDNRATSKSPTPIPTSMEQEAQPRYERKDVQRDLTRRFWSTLVDQSTQTLVEVLHEISEYPAHALRPEAPDPEVFMLSQAPVGPGGGFHLDHPAYGQTPKRQGSIKSKVQKLPLNPSSPNRVQERLDRNNNPDVNSDTDTEIEVDSPPIPPPRPASHQPSRPIADPESPFVAPNVPFLGYPQARSHSPPDQVPQSGSADSNRKIPPANPDVSPSPAPSLSNHSQLRADQSITQISTSSKSLGDPIPPSLPVRAERSMTHASLSSRSLGDPIPTPALGQGLSRRSVLQTPASQHSDRAGSQGQRSEPPLDSRSPSPVSPSILARRGANARSRARGKYLDMVAINSQRAPSQTSGAGPSRRSRERTRNSAPWPSPSARTHRSRTRSSTSMHRHVAPAPDRQAQVAESQIPRSRSSQLATPLPPCSDMQSELLPGDDGDEEGLSDYEAAAKATRSAAQGRKPSMLDLEGHEHFIVLKVKDVLWAFGIHEGSFQIRSVYCIWFEGIYRQVWIKELPGITYRKPSETACAVAVNSIPARRGHLKERLRSIIKSYFGFVHPRNEAQRAGNVKTYNNVMPNRFHLLRPEDNIGYYESEVIDESMTAAFFYSPTAIGVQFPNYFEKMGNSIVAFVLSMASTPFLFIVIQFCISEWEGGSFTKKTLDANYMLSLYICHYEGLKVADSVEDGPMPELRERWYTGSLAASQASSTLQKYIQPITSAEDIRRGQTQRQPQVNAPASPPAPGPSRHVSTPRPSSRHSPLGPLATSPNSSARRSLLRGESSLIIQPLPRPVTPPPDQLADLTPEPTPRRDAEGRYTTSAKGKGHAVD